MVAATPISGPQFKPIEKMDSRAKEEFLEFTKALGNDLSTPYPESNFPGLSPGDRWCLSVKRWKEAHEAGKAPPGIFESTHEAIFRTVSVEELKEYKVN